MSYEQENHKIRKTWEQDQTNANNIAKQKNSKIIIPGNPHIATPKTIFRGNWVSTTPYFSSPIDAHVSYPYNGTLTCVWNYVRKFELDFYQGEIEVNGVRRRITTQQEQLYPTHVDGSVAFFWELPDPMQFPPLQDGLIYEVGEWSSYQGPGYATYSALDMAWYGPSYPIFGPPTWFWSQDAAIDAMITYGGTYIVRARPFSGRWGNWGPSISFATYEEFEVPPRPTNVALLNFQGNTSIGQYSGPYYWTGSAFIPPMHWEPEHYNINGQYVPGQYVPYTYAFPSGCPMMWFTYDSDKCLTTFHQADGEIDMLVTNNSIEGPAFASMGGGFGINPLGMSVNLFMGAAVDHIITNANSKFRVVSSISGELSIGVKIYTQYFGGGVIYQSGPESEWLTLPSSPTSTYWIDIYAYSPTFGAINYLKILTQNCQLDYEGSCFAS